MSSYLMPISTTRNFTPQTSSNTAQRRHKRSKERKKLEIEYDEKFTKMDNEHKRQKDDLAAEKERVLRVLRLQEDDSDFEDSQVIPLTPASLIEQRVQSETPRVIVSPIKVEQIVISDDDEEDIHAPIKVEKRPSQIVTLTYNSAAVKDREDSVIKETIEADESDDCEISSVSSSESRFDLSSDLSYTQPCKSGKVTHKKPSRKRKRVKTRATIQTPNLLQQKHRAKSPIFPSSSQDQNKISAYFPAKKAAHETTTQIPFEKEGTALLLEEAESTPLVRGPRITRAQAQNSNSLNPNHQPCTATERHDLETQYIQKLVEPLEGNLFPPNISFEAWVILDCSLRESSRNGRPDRFFRAVIHTIETEIRDHPSCCSGFGGWAKPESRRCWKMSLMKSLEEQEREMRKCIEHCLELGVDQEMRKAWVEKWPDIDDNG